MAEQPVFERYEADELIHESEFSILSDYICGHMNAYLLTKSIFIDNTIY